MSQWHKAAKVQDISEGEGVVCNLGDKQVALFFIKGQYFAISNICPHKGGPLAEGELKGAVVTCPWHAWEFDVTTGCNPENPNLKVPRHETKIEGDEILVLL